MWLFHIKYLLEETMKRATCDELFSKYPRLVIYWKVELKNITDFGVFMWILGGVDGLLHITDLSWGRVSNHPSEIVKMDETITVKVIDFDEDKKRVSHRIKATIIASMGRS